MLPNRNRSQRKIICIYNITIMSYSCMYSTHVYFFNAALHCADDDDAYAYAFEF